MTQENVELFLSSVYKQLQQMENKNASVVQSIDNQVCSLVLNQVLYLIK